MKKQSIGLNNTYESLKSKGVVFVRDPKEQPYGLVAVFQDLYGNEWDLLQPKRLPSGVVGAPPMVSS